MLLTVTQLFFAQTPKCTSRQIHNQNNIHFSLSEVFSERPIWSPLALRREMQRRGLPLTDIEAVPLVAYSFDRGPWRRMYVRLGYDPRGDPGANSFPRICIWFTHVLFVQMTGALHVNLHGFMSAFWCVFVLLRVDLYKRMHAENPTSVRLTNTRYTYIHIHTHTHMHIHIHIRIHTHTRTHIHACTVHIPGSMPLQVIDFRIPYEFWVSMGKKPNAARELSVCIFGQCYTKIYSYIWISECICPSCMWTYSFQTWA